MNEQELMMFMEMLFHSCKYTSNAKFNEFEEFYEGLLNYSPKYLPKTS